MSFARHRTTPSPSGSCRAIARSPRSRLRRSRSTGRRERRRARRGRSHLRKRLSSRTTSLSRSGPLPSSAATGLRSIAGTLRNELATRTTTTTIGPNLLSRRVRPHPLDARSSGFRSDARQPARTRRLRSPPSLRPGPHVREQPAADARRRARNHGHHVRPAGSQARSAPGTIRPRPEPAATTSGAHAPQPLALSLTLLPSRGQRYACWICPEKSAPGPSNEEGDAMTHRAAYAATPVLLSLLACGPSPTSGLPTSSGGKGVAGSGTMGSGGAAGATGAAGVSGTAGAGSPGAAGISGAAGTTPAQRGPPARPAPPAQRGRLAQRAQAAGRAQPARRAEAVRVARRVPRG